jgi:hypothetical protein
MKPKKKVGLVNLFAYKPCHCFQLLISLTSVLFDTNLLFLFIFLVRTKLGEATTALFFMLITHASLSIVRIAFVAMGTKNHKFIKKRSCCLIVFSIAIFLGELAVRSVMFYLVGMINVYVILCSIVSGFMFTLVEVSIIIKIIIMKIMPLVVIETPEEKEKKEHHLNVDGGYEYGKLDST